MSYPPSGEEIGKKLLSIRKANHISQERMAHIVEVTTRTWARYEKGELKPPLDVLYKFVAATKSKLSDIINLNDDLPGLGVDVVPVERIPVVNHIPASGFVTSYDDELITDWVVTTKLRYKGLFALRVVGDSMAPRIENGDIVILAPGLEFINNKVYAVVTGESEHTLKTVRKMNDHYACIPLNSNYETKVLHESEIVRLIRVVQVLKDFEWEDSNSSKL